VEEQEIGSPEAEEAEPVDRAAHTVGQGVGEVLAAVEVGDGGAAPDVPDEVHPAPGAVDEDQAHAVAGGAAGEGGDGPVGEAAAVVRVEAPEHRQGAVEGDCDRVSPVSV